MNGGQKTPTFCHDCMVTALFSILQYTNLSFNEWVAEKVNFVQRPHKKHTLIGNYFSGKIFSV
jgi:uncharacterized protein YvpB